MDGRLPCERFASYVIGRNCGRSVPIQFALSLKALRTGGGEGFASHLLNVATFGPAERVTAGGGLFISLT